MKKTPPSGVIKNMIRALEAEGFTIIPPKSRATAYAWPAEIRENLKTMPVGVIQTFSPPEGRDLGHLQAYAASVMASTHGAQNFKTSRDNGKLQVIRLA